MSELAIQPRFRATGQTHAGWQIFEEIKKENKRQIYDSQACLDYILHFYTCVLCRARLPRATRKPCPPANFCNTNPLNISEIWTATKFYISMLQTSNLAVLLILSCSINKVPSIQIWQQFLAISRGFVWENFYFSYIPMLQTTNLAVLLILSLFCPKCLRVGRSRGP